MNEYEDENTDRILNEIRDFVQEERENYNFNSAQLLWLIDKFIADKDFTLEEYE